PAPGLKEADAAEQRSRRPLLDRPQPEASQPPVSEDQRHLSPGLAAGQRLAVPEIAHHLAIGAHRGVGIEVLLAKHPEKEPLRLERDLNRGLQHRRPYALGDCPGARHSSMSTSALRRVFTSPSWRALSSRARD